MLKSKQSVNQLKFLYVNIGLSEYNYYTCHVQVAFFRPSLAKKHKTKSGKQAKTEAAKKTKVTNRKKSAFQSNNPATDLKTAQAIRRALKQRKIHSETTRLNYGFFRCKSIKQHRPLKP